MSRIHFKLLVSIALLLLTGRGYAQEDSPSVDTASAAPEISSADALEVGDLRRLSPLSEVWVDEKNKTLVVGGQVTMDEGPLEMFACPKGTKEYESVVSVNCQAYVIHSGLLAIGAKSGHPVRFSPEYQAATGDRIRIMVEWKDESGEWRSMDARKWVQDSASGDTLTVDWVFAGSGFWTDPETKEEYYHAEGGELVCVSNFSTATLDLPIQSSQRNDQRLYQSNSDAVPAIGTRVKLLFSVVTEGADATQQGNSEGMREAVLNVNPGKNVANTITTNENGESQEIPYLLFTPRNYEEASFRWPVIFFLHGFGESGSGGPELSRVKIHGPPMLAEKNPDFPYIVVSPQCPQPLEEIIKIKAAWREGQLIQLLDHVLANTSSDPNRVYISGLSMGGFGTWRMAAKYPDRFAAAVPICGGGEPGWAPALRELPIWCFHGQRDEVVKPAESQRMIKAIQALGGKPKLTLYPDIGHNSWAPAYDDPALFEWMSSQKRGS